MGTRVAQHPRTAQHKCCLLSPCSSSVWLLSVYTSLCNPKSAGTVSRYDKMLRSDVLYRLGQGVSARVPPPEVKPSGCLTAMLCWLKSEVHGLNNLMSYWHDIPLPLFGHRAGSLQIVSQSEPCCRLLFRTPSPWPANTTQLLA